MNGSGELQGGDLARNAINYKQPFPEKHVEEGRKRKVSVIMTAARKITSDEMFKTKTLDLALNMRSYCFP